MGVQGLVSFMETHREIYRDVFFRSSRLVIDGANLIYQLYFSSDLDQNHGGEYAAFEDLIEEFINALRACEVEPCVVLNGVSDFTNKKLDTHKQRAEERYKKAHEASLGQSKNILPPLARLVFKQKLAQLKVQVVQCFGEADEKIAALVREWRCPVLSLDSDFYIFDLPDGLLPYNLFQWKALEGSGSNRFIPCKIYKICIFCKFFKIERQIMPAFAVFAGYDFVKLGENETFPDWARGVPGQTRRTGHLEGLLSRLKGFKRPEEALKELVRLMGGLTLERRKEVLHILSEAMEKYQIPACSLMTFLEDGIAPPLPAVEVFGRVPDWFRLPLVQGRMCQDILKALLLQRINLSISVEHKDLPSSSLMSRPVRQVMYGLLLGEGEQVQERDRKGLQQESFMVQTVSRGAARHLSLNSLHEAEASVRRQVFLETLEVDESFLSPLPPQQHLLVAVTCYWLKKAQPPPELLRALLLGMTNTHTRTHTAVVQAGSTQSEQKLSWKVSHSLNQWQVCLKDSIYLNQLLGWPLPEPHIARLYQGLLVHQLVCRLRDGITVETILHEIPENRHLLDHFNDLLN